MELLQQNGLNDIMRGVSCPRDFMCHKSEFKTPSDIGHIGLTSLVLCTEKHAQQCEFSLEFGNHHLCKCAVRIYIANQLRK